MRHPATFARGTQLGRCPFLRLLPNAVFFLAWTVYLTRQAVEKTADAAKATEEAVDVTDRVGRDQVGAMLASAEAMERSAAAAQRSANAANESNELNRDIYIARERPRIRIVNAFADGPLIIDGTGARFSMTVQIQNVGKPPAHSFGMAAVMVPLRLALRKERQVARAKARERAKTFNEPRWERNVLNYSQVHVQCPWSEIDKHRKFVELPGGAFQIQFAVVGCATYAMDFPKHWFDEEFVFTLTHRGGVFLVINKRLRVEPNELMLSEHRIAVPTNGE